MNVDDKVEVGRILEQTDSLTEVLGAIGLPQYMLYVRRGWHPERGATAEYVSEEALSRGPP